MPAKALKAVRMVLASEQLHSQRSAADFAKQVDPLHEESCLQVMLIAADSKHQTVTTFYVFKQKRKSTLSCKLTAFGM